MHYSIKTNTTKYKTILLIFMIILFQKQHLTWIYQIKHFFYCYIVIQITTCNKLWFTIEANARSIKMLRNGYWNKSYVYVTIIRNCTMSNIFWYMFQILFLCKIIIMNDYDTHYWLLNGLIQRGQTNSTCQQTPEGDDMYHHHPQTPWTWKHE